MAKYLLIESRDPFEAKGASDLYDLAATLAKGDEVTLLLVQNGVFPARRCRESHRASAPRPSPARATRGWASHY